MPLLLPPLLLSACGGKDVPPEQYSSNDTALPALTSTLSSENIQFSHKEGSEDQPDSYVYSGLSSMTDTLASYVQALEEDGCSPIDTNGVVKELPDFSVSSGSVSMGKDTGDGGVFQLQIAWEGDTCTITPVYAAELRITQPSVQALTVSEAIQRLKSCTPALLGLSGASMEEYEVYAEEGLVLVDSSPCLQLNVYSSTPRQYRGCYLMTVDGAHLYQLDRDASQVTELTPYSNTAVALSPLHISPSPFIAFYGGDFVKATNFIVTERRLSSEQFPDLSLIRRAVTLWLRNALYRRL